MIGQKIIDWIHKIEQQNIEKSDSAFSNVFGFITTKDGRKAQIKVVLELDEDDWD